MQSTRQLLLLFLTTICLTLQAQSNLPTPPKHDRAHAEEYTPRAWRNMVRHSPDAFFSTPEAREIGDRVLLYQRKWGGWPKNQSMNRPLSTKRDSLMLNPELDDCTIDNGATTTPMLYLARLWQATHEEKYREAFERGVEYLLQAQYKDSGGWPQFWPNAEGYRPHITYNDNAMVNVMKMLRDIRDERAPYNGIIDKSVRRRVGRAFDKGIRCILKTQIRVNGEPTVWCQQHDHETLQPAKARAYELPSFCSQESAEIVRLLMSLPHPNKRIKTSIEGAMKWFEAHKIKDLRLERFTADDGKPDTRLVKDANAPAMWARYYDLDTQQPLFSDRDGLKHATYEEVSRERRVGYAWYVTTPSDLNKRYEAWKQKHKK